MSEFKRRIAVVTTSRADYGIYRPLLARLEKDPAIELRLIVAGTHLEPAFGMTVGEIEADGFPIAERVQLQSAEDSQIGTAQSMARGLSGFAGAYVRLRPHMAVVLGDRFEMFAAAAAAQPFALPLAHIHGGELTLGAMDDGFRHAMTKLSHLHFVAARDYARRVRQMGEEDWRVHVSGALGLDNLDLIEPLAGADLEDALGMALTPAPLMVAYHPVTRDLGGDEAIKALFDALAATNRPLVFTAPNADAGGRALKDSMAAFVAQKRDARFIENLGTRGYFGLMGAAAVLVGNSSSGILEAPSFRLPVVNIGPRQEGRLRAANVIDVGEDEAAIGTGIERALSDDFREGLRNLKSPFRGPRPAAGIIHGVLSRVPLDAKLLKKKFIDMGK